MTLDQRVARLESSLRRWKLGAFAALLTGVCCAANGVDKFPNPERLTEKVFADSVICKRFGIVQNDGAPLFDVALSSKGHGVMTIYSADGAQTVVVAGMNGILAQASDGTKKLIQ